MSKTIEEIQEFREKWAKRKSYDNWQDVLDTVRGNDKMLTNIIDDVSKKYAIEVSKQSLKNANYAFEKYYYLDNADMPFEKNKIKELITQVSNIPNLSNNG